MEDSRPGEVVEGILAAPAGGIHNSLAVEDNPVGEARSTPAVGRLGCWAAGDILFHQYYIFVLLLKKTRSIRTTGAQLSKIT